MSALDRGLPEPEARGLAFAARGATNLVLAFADPAEPGTRFFDPHRLVFFGIAGAEAIVGLILLSPPLTGRLEGTRPPYPSAEQEAAACGCQFTHSGR